MVAAARRSRKPAWPRHSPAVLPAREGVERALSAHPYGPRIVSSPRPRRRRSPTASALAVAAPLLALPGAALAHTFSWDGSAADAARPGTTLRWDRTLSSCGDTSPFRTLKVPVHQGQTPIAAEDYMVAIGRRQVLKNGTWVTLGPGDEATKRGANGAGKTHATLQFYLRYVDKGMRSRVRLRLQWKRAAGEPGDADHTVVAKRTVSTTSCRVP